MSPLNAALAIGVAGLVFLAESQQIATLIDGDTLRLASGETIRILGIDAPETSRAKCPEERVQGEAALTFLAQLDIDGRLVVTRGGRRDQYHRRIARVLFCDPNGCTDVAERMISTGHARPYSGGQRKGWCPGTP